MANSAAGIFPSENNNSSVSILYLLVMNISILYLLVMNISILYLLVMNISILSYIIHYTVLKVILQSFFLHLWFPTLQLHYSYITASWKHFSFLSNNFIHPLKIIFEGKYKTFCPVILNSFRSFANKYFNKRSLKFSVCF